MEILSPYIIAGGAGWVISQLSKYVVASMNVGKLASVRQLYLSGHMPSAHSATVIAILTVIGLKDGIGSGLFGLALVFASVVLYDAMMVRRSSGEQGIAITGLIKESKSKVPLPRVAIGHTPLEVAVGSLIGLAVGVAVYYATIG
ncbi:MAG: divergent PAP2 family protein [Candidatus Saccharimonadaceae bacterium]